MKLDAEKLKGVIEGIRQVARLEDTLGIATLKRELMTG